VAEQGAGPRTWFAGESSPEDARSAQAGAWITGIALVVVSPVAVITAALGYLSFTRWRIKPGVIAQAALLLTAVFTVTGLAWFSASGYVESFFGFIEHMRTDGFSMLALAKALAVQAPLSLIIGSWAGSAYSAWRWYRRSVWEEPNFRLTPRQWFRKRANIRDIREDKKSPRNGATLGISPQGDRVIQGEKEASAHSFFIGASGSGKTTTALVEARDYIKQGHGYVFIDLKGAGDVPAALAEYAERYGRRFQHFLFHDPRKQYTGPAQGGPAFYDPLARGDASRRKDMVISGRKWSDDYYKILSSAYLQTAFDVMIGSPNPGVDAFTDIVYLLSPSNLALRALALPKEPYYDDLRAEVHRVSERRLEFTEQSALDGMQRELQTIRSSTAGRWLRLDADKEKNIDIYRAADRGDVIVFSLDALTYPETAKMIANLVISDLKTVTGDLIAQPTRNPLHVFIDEFSALDSEGITGLINKSRSAGMPIALATQALGDLKRIDPAFLEQLLGIINCFVIHRANTLDDAETLSGIIGKDKKWEVRLGIEHTSGTFGSIGKGAATGTGMVDKVEDFIVSPKVIQDLRAGQVIYVAKSPESRVVEVQVIPEREDITSSGLGGQLSTGGRENLPFITQRPEETIDQETPATVVPVVVSTPSLPALAPRVSPDRPAIGILDGRDLRKEMGRTPPSVVPAATPAPARTPAPITAMNGSRMTLPSRPALPPRPGAPVPNSAPNLSSMPKTSLPTRAPLDSEQAKRVAESLARDDYL